MNYDDEVSVGLSHEQWQALEAGTESVNDGSDILTNLHQAGEPPVFKKGAKKSTFGKIVFSKKFKTNGGGSDVHKRK